MASLRTALFDRGSSLSAYQQGSFFLFDIKKDADQSKAVAERIAVPASVFKKSSKTTDSQLAQKEEPKSEFESGISVFETADLSAESSKFQILDTEASEEPTESTFGETPKASSGFFFTY